ncbi:MAG: hypothetical protein JO276_17355 [Sphingomonadaceae bacterium]|nr:hypothetical protein [Sphingomonadaceae bacterium]
MTRKFLIAAGLLCLGTSPAFAFSIPPMAPDMAKAVKDVWADQMAAEKPSIFDTGEAWMSQAVPAKPVSGAAIVEKASFDTVKAGEPMAKADDMLAKPDDVAAKSVDAVTDMGPSEPVLKTDPLPAAAYPPCSRSRSDDHCIQLYEPGVRAQVAEWNRTSSGAETAMGGPYEPVDTTLAGEIGGTSMPAGSEYSGVGGPLETTAYPPCSRTVTDRCIQTYERGRAR